MKKQSNILLLAMIFLVNLIISKDPELENRARLVACLNLTRARMTQDRATIEALVGHEEGEDNKNSHLNRIMIMTLLYCYKSIPLHTAGDKKQMSEIDSLSQESRDLLNIENWEEVYRSRDPQELEEEIRDIQNRLEDLNKRAGEKGDQENRREGEEEEQQYQDIPVDRKKNQFTLFGVNISELSPEVKNLIGFSLLALLIVASVYAIKRLRKEMERPEKNRKKKNK